MCRFKYTITAVQQQPYPIRKRTFYNSVQSARPQESWINEVRSAGSSYNWYSTQRLNSIQLCQQLVHYTICHTSIVMASPEAHTVHPESQPNLTFVGPCIVIYFYSKTNQMHNISNLFYFGTTLYMFRTVSPSIIRSLRLYIQHHTIQVLWPLVSKQLQNLYDKYLMLYVQS